MHLRNYYKARSAKGKAMASKRWELDRERRNEEENARLAELAVHPLISQGNPIGSLQFRDFRTGEVKRWTILRGDRVDRVILRTPDGRTSKSHGWTRVLATLRGVFAGTK